MLYKYEVIGAIHMHPLKHSLEILCLCVPLCSVYDPVGLPANGGVPTIERCINAARQNILDQWCQPAPLDPADPPSGAGICTPCTVCPPGTFIASPCGAVTAARLFPGFTDQKCSPCGANCLTCSGATTCTSCAAGKNLVNGACVLPQPTPTTPTIVPAVTPTTAPVVTPVVNARAPPPPPKLIPAVKGRRML